MTVSDPKAHMRLHTNRIAMALGGVVALSAATGVQADARDEVVAAFRAAMSEDSYRMHLEVANKRGPVLTQIDVQLPNRFHIRSSEIDFISIANVSYINAGGTWTQVPVDMSSQLQGFRITDLEQAASALTNVETGPEEVVKGCKSRLYRYQTSSTVAGRSSQDQAELAICQTNGLPVRLRSAPTTKGEAVTIHYDYDAKVDIRAPL
ncbi:MAG: hypothetical protein ACT4NL_03285 [Pseudomarimonas sp.]